jgi:DNA-binding SARP family transcriptional activator
VSVNYLRYDGEVLSVDPELVLADSVSFQRRASATRPSEQLEDALATVRLYGGRFAPGFQYDDWAITWREALHGQFLSLVQATLRELAISARLDEATSLAQRVMVLDPEALDVELTLVWLYSHGGAWSAAGEQYRHFAASHHDLLGLDAPSLAQVTGLPPDRLGLL